VKLGIGTYCYMWAIGFKFGDKEARPAQPMSAMALLERARDLGVHLVQYGPNLPMTELSDMELDAIVRNGQAWDVEFELATRGLETEHLAQQIMLLKRLGGSLLRTIPELGGKPVEASCIPEYLQAILPVLQREQVKLGLENGKVPAKELAWALDKVGSPAVGVVLDTANSLAVPEGWQYVTEILAPYTICLHHKEFVVKRVWYMMGFTVEGQPAGKGQVDTPWLLETLDKAGAQYNVILEVWPPEEPNLEDTIATEDRWVRESIPYLRQFIKD